MRILAVDDDPVILELLRNALTKHDTYELTCCDSAEDAEDLLARTKQPFECFLLDIHLPGVTGIEFCSNLRQTDVYRTVPIIMITASRESDLMGQAFYAGATDFLPKPLDGVELGARINSASMLNESRRREREAQNTLAALSRQSRLDFEDAVRLDAEGVLDVMGLENALLRLPAGCYGMNLFSVDILGLRGVFRTVDGPAFRQHLEAVAEATTDALGKANWMLAYAGNGRFVGLTLERLRLNRDRLIERIETILKENWDEELCGVASPPEVRVSSVSDQRILSGLSASDKIREYLKHNDLTEGLGLEQEENLFRKFEKRSAAA